MKALLVIDYTNDFVADDGALTCGKVAQDIEENIVKKIKEYENRKDLVLAVNDIHYENEKDHPEDKLFPKHNILGTEGRMGYGKVGKLLEYTRTFPINKTRYSAFYNTSLKRNLDIRDIKDIELCGVCTDICILHTAVDAYNLGYKVTIDSGCVASFNQAGHEWALNHFKNVLGFTVL